MAYAVAAPHSAKATAAANGPPSAPLPPARIDLRSDTVTLPTPAVRAPFPAKSPS